MRQSKEGTADWALLPATREEVLERCLKLDAVELYHVYERVMESYKAIRVLSYPYLYGEEIRHAGDPFAQFKRSLTPTWVYESWENVCWLKNKLSEMLPKRE